MNPSRDATNEQRTVPNWAAASLVAAASTITWWVTSINADHGLDHMIGPYQVPLTIEYVVGGIALALGLLALRASISSTRAGRGVTRPTTVLLVLTAMLAAGLWRVMTAGVVGANIGGGPAALGGPILIAASLFLAVCVQRSTSGVGIRTFVGWTVLTLATGPILFFIVSFGLDR